MAKASLDEVFGAAWLHLYEDLCGRRDEVEALAVAKACFDEVFGAGWLQVFEYWH